MTTTKQQDRDTSGGPNTRVLAIVGAVVAVVVAIGIVIALSGGDDDGDGGSGASTEEALTFGTVAVEGSPLPSFESPTDDPGVGEAAPALTGQAFDGTEVTVEAGEPTLVVFLAHWCPHCQAELPLLVDISKDGGFDGVRTVAVLTGTNPQAPNFPPAAWLDEEGWTGDELVDDEDSTAAAAYGLTSYPFLVALDAEGNVTGRASGELPEDDVLALVDSAR